MLTPLFTLLPLLNNWLMSCKRSVAFNDRFKAIKCPPIALYLCRDMQMKMKQVQQLNRELPDIINLYTRFDARLVHLSNYSWYLLNDNEWFTSEIFHRTHYFSTQTWCGRWVSCSDPCRGYLRLQHKPCFSRSWLTKESTLEFQIQFNLPIGESQIFFV